MLGNMSSRASSTQANPWASSRPQPQYVNKGPGLGAGAGIGSGLVHSMFNGFGNRSQSNYAEQNNHQLQMQYQQQQQQIEMMRSQNHQNQVCQTELKQFMNCASNHGTDLNMCQAF